MHCLVGACLKPALGMHSYCRSHLLQLIWKRQGCTCYRCGEMDVDWTRLEFVVYHWNTQTLCEVSCYECYYDAVIAGTNRSYHEKPRGGQAHASTRTDLGLSGCVSIDGVELSAREGLQMKLEQAESEFLQKYAGHTNWSHVRYRAQYVRKEILRKFLAEHRESLRVTVCETPYCENLVTPDAESHFDNKWICKQCQKYERFKTASVRCVECDEFQTINSDGVCPRCNRRKVKRKSSILRIAKGLLKRRESLARFDPEMNDPDTIWQIGRLITTLQPDQAIPNELSHADYQTERRARLRGLPVSEFYGNICPYCGHREERLEDWIVSYLFDHCECRNCWEEGVRVPFLSKVLPGPVLASYVASNGIRLRDVESVNKGED